MKSLFKLFSLLLLVIISSCSSDDTGTDVITELSSKTYILTTVDNSGISGSVRFVERSNFTLSIELSLVGTSNNDFHSAFLYLDNAANNGEEIALTLNVVDGETGLSTTIFTALDDDTAISYQELLDFDGHIEVKSNDVSLNTPVANTDIGQNELTSTQVTYTLEERQLTDCLGDITFKKRKNGEALAVFNLTGTPSGGMHPATIRSGNMASASGINMFTFNTINGTTGTSDTNVEMLDDGTLFLYDNVLSVDGYIDVELSNTNTLLIAQGNIGSN